VRAFNVGVAPVDLASEGQQCVGLLPAEPNRVVPGRRESRDIARRRKGMPSALAGPTSDVAHRGQSIECFEADL